MTAMSMTIDELPVPASLDDPLATDLHAVVGIRNAVTTEALGPAAGRQTVQEILPFLQDRQFEQKQILVARTNGEIVGYAVLVWSVDPGARATWMVAGVPPPLRRQGIGTALFDRAEDIARASGRPVLQGNGFHLPVDGPRLEPPTGFGSVPRNEPGVRFLVNRGFILEQVSRYSELRLPINRETLESHLAAARAKAGSDYRVHTWTSITPEQWLDDVAAIFTRMPTDAPTGNLKIEEEPWDAGRVRKNDQQRMEAGRTALVAAVEHIPSGKLVAYNGLSIADDRSRPVSQGITLVLREHRGHRLGMITKIANIQQLQAFSPESRSILTDNAEENRPMLDVNEAIGFTPIAWEGAWKKTFA